MGKMSSRDYQEMATRFDSLLRLASFPVAVKMLEDARMLNDIKDEKGRPLRQIDHELTICQFLGQSSYLGATQGGTAENLVGCLSGGAFMGFWKLADDYADGYVRAYFPTEELARKALATVPRFEPGTHAAMVASPLGQMPVDPDVVIFFANAAQTLRLTAAYIYKKGEKIDAEFNIAGGCAQPIVSPMRTGKPNIFIPTNGARILGLPSDNDLSFSIPAASLPNILEGLELTHRNMIRYPTTWQHLNWETHGIIRNVLKGKGFFPPEQRHPESK